jgi:hypothetical protein
MLHNLQHRPLYRIQQLRTDHNVRHCICISEVDPDLSIKEDVLFQKPFFLRKYQKIPRHNSKRKLQDMVKRKMTKD